VRMRGFMQILVKWSSRRTVKWAAGTVAHLTTQPFNHLIGAAASDKMYALCGLSAPHDRVRELDFGQ
jgi:hypothetical protein